MRSVDSIYFKGKCELYASRGNVGGSRRRGSGITPAGFKGRVGGCGWSWRFFSSWLQQPV